MEVPSIYCYCTLYSSFDFLLEKSKSKFFIWMKVELFISSYQWLKKWKGLQFKILNEMSMSGLDWISGI